MLLSLVVKFVLYFVLWKERKYAKKRLGFVHFLKKEKKGLIGLWADVETKKTRFKKRQKIDENFVSDSPHFPYFNFHTFFLKKNFLEIAFWASFFGRFLHRKSFSLNVRTSAAFCETIKLSKMSNFGKTYFGKLKFSPILGSLKLRVPDAIRSQFVISGDILNSWIGYLCSVLTLFVGNRAVVVAQLVE